jgi:hypothetical protein
MPRCGHAPPLERARRLNRLVVRFLMHPLSASGDADYPACRKATFGFRSDLLGARTPHVGDLFSDKWLQQCLYPCPYCDPHPCSTSRRENARNGGYPPIGEVVCLGKGSKTRAPNHSCSLAIHWGMVLPYPIENGGISLLVRHGTEVIASGAKPAAPVSRQSTPRPAVGPKSRGRPSARPAHSVRGPNQSHPVSAGP